MNGFFVSVEGPRFSGTSTQSKLLYQRLKDGGGVLIEPWKESLKERGYNSFSDPEIVGNFNPLSSWDVLNREIAGSLERGKLVVADRYKMPFEISQWNQGVDLSALRQMQKGFIKPDLTILLDRVDPNIFLECAEQRGYSFGAINPDSLSESVRVHREFRKLYHENPDLFGNIAVVSAGGPEHEVHHKISRVVDEVYQGKYGNALLERVGL